MPQLILVAMACLAVAAFVEVIRRTRNASRKQLADQLVDMSTSLAQLADDLDGDRSGPAACADLVEQLDHIRGVLSGNSLCYGIQDDLIIGLSASHEEYAVGPGRARRLTFEVGRQLKTGSSEVEIYKLRSLSRLFKDASQTLKTQ